MHLPTYLPTYLCTHHHNPISSPWSAPLADWKAMHLMHYYPDVTILQCGDKEEVLIAGKSGYGGVGCVCALHVCTLTIPFHYLT